MTVIKRGLKIDAALPLADHEANGIVTAQFREPVPGAGHFQAKITTAARISRDLMQPFKFFPHLLVRHIRDYPCANAIPILRIEQQPGFGERQV